jgi:hypothetical protein
VHDIPNYRVSQTGNVNTFQLLACSPFRRLNGELIDSVKKRVNQSILPNFQTKFVSLMYFGSNTSLESIQLLLGSRYYDSLLLRTELSVIYSLKVFL